MMWDYGMMDGYYGGGMMTFGWVVYLLVIVDLVLGAAALWKYVNKK